MLTSAALRAPGSWWLLGPALRPVPTAARGAELRMRVRVRLLPALVVLLLLAAPCASRRKGAAKAPRQLKHVFETQRAFKPEECERIIAAAKALPQEQAVTKDQKTKDGKMTDARVRDGSLTWLDMTEGSEMRWVLDRMNKYLGNGERTWGVKSLGLGNPVKGIQVARYGPTDHYEWHTDTSPGARVRVMSVTVQLSPPSDYEGGHVEFGTHGNASTEVGTMVLFASYLPHKVHKVTSGARYSIVAWFGGDAPEPYWKLAESSYTAMIASRPDICDAHEWMAVQLSKFGRHPAAKDSLVNGIDCNDGTRLLSASMVENSAGTPRHREALVSAADRFRARAEDDELHEVTALVNLKTALRWLGKHARNEEEAVAFLTEAMELDPKIESGTARQRQRKQREDAAAAKEGGGGGGGGGREEL
jgi:PKHD-type hydroxylase